MIPNDENHDPEARFKELWRHRERVARMVGRKFGRTPHDEDVQDAVAATYLRALRYLREGRSIAEETEIGWLYTVGWREFLRAHARRARYDRLHPDHEANLAGGDLPVDETVTARLERTDLDRALEKALSRLTPRQRAVLLAVESGMSYAEVRRQYGISATALNKALVRGRRRLRADSALRQAYRRWTD